MYVTFSYIVYVCVKTVNSCQLIDLIWVLVRTVYCTASVDGTPEVGSWATSVSFPAETASCHDLIMLGSSTVNYRPLPPFGFKPSRKKAF